MNWLMKVSRADPAVGALYFWIGLTVFAVGLAALCRAIAQ